MKIPTHSNHSDFPNEQEWRQIDQLIRSISEDHELDALECLTESVNDYPFREKDRAIFDAALEKYSGLRSPGRSSMVERWAAQQIQMNWLAVLQKRIDAVRQANRQAWGEMQAFFGSLESMIEALTQRMTP
ncbi:MAG: hypothetical protein JXR73_01915, partial [Candidatus Omnitrophica bacterium]|nr:hypothetical protein [Candidatus Omnitrophota bacterium]